MLREIERNQLVAILLIEPNIHFRRLIASEIYKRYGSLVKLFIAQTRLDALNSLKQLYLDGFIVSAEMLDCDGINLLREIRTFRIYKTTSIITMSKDPSEQMQVKLKDEVNAIAHFKKLAFERSWDLTGLLNGVGQIIDIVEEKITEMTFEQKRQADFRLDCRDFIVAWSLLSEKKTCVVYREPETGESKQQELMGYTFEKFKARLKKGYHWLNVDHDKILNPNMVETVDFVKSEFVLRHTNIRIPVPKSRRKEIYQLFRGWSS